MGPRNKPSTLDIRQVLLDLQAAGNEVRVAFLCSFAHSLTVDIRSVLLDRPVSDADADRIYHLNDYMHQLTSCVNPAQRRAAKEDAELVGDIIASARRWGVESAVGRALATAAGNTLPSKIAAV